MIHRKTLSVLVVSTLIVVASAAAENSPRPLLRFPDIHNDTVAFVHAEDIWTASAAGGPALRLTDDEGEDRHPRFSPDGSMLAYTSQAGGNADVWVMHSDGSDPRRLTFHPGADEVIGWHPIQNKVLFRSNRLSWSRFDRLFLISPDGSGLEVLPLHEAGRGAYAPDGQHIVYNRIAREDRTWKRYRGGMAQDLWLYDFSTGTDRQLTTFEGTDRLPLWVGDQLYFASDRDHTLNLFTFHLENGTVKKVTDHKVWDARRPETDGRRIVYEQGGDVQLFDPSTGDNRRLDITIATPARETKNYRREVAENITDINIAPEGGRALLSARGEIFTVPKEHGATRNLSNTPGARERNATWSPDGRFIAWVSDADGESDLWITAAGGHGTPRRLTDLGPGYRHTLRWSPDSTLIAFADQTLRYHVLDIDSKAVTTIDRSEREPMDIALEAKPISDYSWSPDGRYLAYSKIGLDMVSRIWIHDLDSGESHDVSDGRFNDFGPVFTPDGQHLLFISNRHFRPTLGDFEWEMVYKDLAGVYALTLKADGEALLPLLSDEIAPAGADTPSSGAKNKKTESVTVHIDWDQLAHRLEALPLPAGNYRHLSAVENKVFYLNGSDGDYNPFEFRALAPQKLAAFDLKKREASTQVKKVDDYRVSADGLHLVWRRGEKVGIKKIGDSGPHFEKMAEKNDKTETLDLERLVVTIDPRAEWAQVYDEAWRLERDFYYDPGMNGLDWPAVGQRYRALVTRATCAQDMRYILGELIGELSTSHTYASSGDRRLKADRVNVGMLGADFEAVNNHWKITRIYDVADWNREILPPLAGPGINAREGLYLMAVNGDKVRAHLEPHAWFQGLAEVPTRLTLNDSPSFEGAWDITVKPLRNERRLRYQAWVEHNRKVADEASGGAIGYLHFPDTYMGSAAEFPRQYYSQVMKDGLIIDGRFNGGGLDPDIFLARLAKKPLSYWTRRYSADQQTPWYVSRAHMACLTNRQAGSGGDELPFEFREKGMGPVIGTRTWGGLVGISMYLSLMDGSGLTAPDYRIYTTDGQGEFRTGVGQQAGFRRSLRAPRNGRCPERGLGRSRAGD
jgi:tricorn protease